MRYALALLLASAAGCSSSSNPMDMSVVMPDMTVAGGDMSVNTTCDIILQTGCISTQKCIPAIGDTAVVGACVDKGTAAEGAPCTQTSDTTQYNDDCVGGTSCDNNGPNATYTCKKLCGANSGCTTAGQKCFAFLDPSFGVCVPTCTPFGTGCPTGNDCSSSYPDIESSMASYTGYFFCKMTGAGILGGACNGDTDCASGLWCASGQCVPNCDNTHACPTIDADFGALTCSPFANLSNGTGYCF